MDNESLKSGNEGREKVPEIRKTPSFQLHDLAQRIAPVARWEDLVLPRKLVSDLKKIALQAAQRLKETEPGSGAMSSGGLNSSSLFVGESGTGKTMAAEVIANALQLDLYRVDLSRVVSKYIGETEKNLEMLFDRAEHGDMILFFDEADALFGKRSEVKDSHDRFANSDASYLLQRMEAFPGLVILATNKKSALDQAFLRRIRFVVSFPFPDDKQRAEIWKHMFPDETAKENLDWKKLSRLNIPGGIIKNIALNAILLAAKEGVSLNMSHISVAAQSEYSRLEKQLSPDEMIL